MWNMHSEMSERLRNDLEESWLISRPMKIHWDETKEARCAEKKVLYAKSLHDMCSLDGWETITPYAHLEVSDAHVYEGMTRSLCFTSPCKLEKWTGRIGRIYTIPKAFLHIDHENWEKYDRLTAWIYPDMPGYRNVCVRIQLHNDGERKVPDTFDRYGGHNLNIRNHEWNRISFEIPDVARDDVIGVSVDYDMVGNEPCAEGTARWYIGKLLVEKVEKSDKYEGWDTEEGLIAYSHLGYQTGAPKSAIAANLNADQFQLLKNDEVVYVGKIQHMKANIGNFDVMDFSDFRSKGTYRLKAGTAETEEFEISDYVWMDSIWKTINFIFSQRCGFRVPGKHDLCHADQRTRHGDKEIIANGGWHDAADTNQQIQLTCEAVHALLELSITVKNDDPVLHCRLLDEGIWGLTYLIKGRFGDGYRTGPSSSAIWTDNIRGTCDDLTFDAVNAPFVNLLAASSEAMGYKAMLEEDQVLADYSLKCAKEDFLFGTEMLDDPEFDPGVIYPGHDKMVSMCLMKSIAAYTAMELYEITRDALYIDYGVKYGNYVVDCQQRTNLKTEIGDICGFFYRDTDHKTAIHYNHRSQEDKTMLALISLCRMLPEHPDFMRWHSAIVYYQDYIKKIMFSTAPYGMLPSGIYSTDEIDDRKTFALMHNIFAIFSKEDEERQRAQTYLHYEEQLKEGVKLDDSHYLRRFPVWYSFRGNFHVQLSAGKGVSAASIYLNDPELYRIAQEQLEWVIGKNPFSESMMFGTGNRYGCQYAVLHGDVVGGLPVGLQSFEEHDSPYWPQASNATYREIWMGPPGKWLAMMVDEYLPGQLIADEALGCVRITDNASKETSTWTVYAAGDTHSLPAGEYGIETKNGLQTVVVIAGGKYHLKAQTDACQLSYTENADGTVIIRVNGTGKFSIRTDNLAVDCDRLTLHAEEKIIRASVINPKAPWCCSIVSVNQPAMVRTVYQ